MEDKITLEKDVFKALASDTRIEIIKLLGKRRHTQSEIAHYLNMSVPTIKEHLDAMARAELVKSKDEGYKWKYYELTEKAKCLLDPERKKVWIILGFWIIAAVGTLFVFMKNIFGRAMVGKLSTSAFSAAQESLPMASKVADNAVPTAAGAASEASAANGTLAAVPSINETVKLGAQTLGRDALGVPFPYVEVIFIVALIALTVLLLVFLFRSRMLRKRK